MNKTKIEWADYVWNPVIGCKRGCPYCYAKKINDRFHLIPDFTKPEWREKSFNKPMPKKPARIFVNSMSDICYWEPEQIERVITRAMRHQEHKFLFLTKDATIYGKYTFPSNYWLGMTYTEGWTAKFNLNNDMNIKFISMEPLQKRLNLTHIMHIWDWWIVGGLTPKPVHHISWVDDIVRIANSVLMPLFLKNNLHYPIKIQEYPK